MLPFHVHQHQCFGETFHTGFCPFLQLLTGHGCTVHPYTHSTIDPLPPQVRSSTVHLGPHPTGPIPQYASNTHEPHFDQVWVFLFGHIPPNDLRSPARPLQLRVPVPGIFFYFYQFHSFKKFITTCNLLVTVCCCRVGLQNYVKSN